MRILQYAPTKRNRGPGSGEVGWRKGKSRDRLGYVRDGIMITIEMG